MADDEIGALWRREGKSGQYFTGTINTAKMIEGEVKIVVFPITNKRNDRQPDFRILISKPREGTR